MPISEANLRQFAFDSIGRLNAATAAEGIAAELRRAGAALGFDNFCISGLPLPGEAVDPYVMLSGWPEEWMARYVQKNYIHVDPVIKRVKETTMPFDWREAASSVEDRNAGRVMSEATDFGLVEGFAVPIYTAHGFQAIVTFGAQRLDLSQDGRAGLHLIAIYAHSKIRSLLNRSSSSPQQSKLRLSSREIDCLKWSASGKTTWEISAILNLSQRTVEDYLTNAARKLGAVNRVQSVAEAFRQKVIT